jgi:hypothetical protein
MPTIREGGFTPTDEDGDENEAWMVCSQSKQSPTTYGDMESGFVTRTQKCHENGGEKLGAFPLLFFSSDNLNYTGICMICW